MSVPEGLKADVLRAVRDEPVASRSKTRVRDALVVGAACTLAVVIFVAAGGFREFGAPRSAALILQTAVGAFGIAMAALWVLAARGRSMLGRSRVVLFTAVLATPFVLLAWKIGWTAVHPGAFGFFAERLGLKCLTLSTSVGLFPLLALVFMRKASDPVHPLVTGVSLGVVTGAFAWVLTDLWCPVAYVPHLFLGHVLPIAILAGVGAALGHWLIRMRAP